MYVSSIVTRGCGRTRHVRHLHRSGRLFHLRTRPARFRAAPRRLLLASFGVTLLAVSVPMGAVSDRIGRRLPLTVGLLALAASTALFAVSRSLPWLFVARLIQGAADAVTWVVGFALISDLYGDDERGRVSGIIMMGTSAA